MLAFAPDRGQAVSHRGKRLREVPGPFVVAPPCGARVRTRLAVNDNDEMVLKALGAHLGHLASLDLARRVAEGSLDAKGKAKSRQARKQALTAASSSRWAGAITRTSEDAYGLAKRNLQAQQVSLRARVDKITKRVALGPGEAKERLVGYASASERWEKQRRVQVLRSRLADVEAQLAIGTLSVCRGGKRRARAPVLRMAYHWFGLAPQHVGRGRRTARPSPRTARRSRFALVASPRAAVRPRVRLLEPGREGLRARARRGRLPLAPTHWRRPQSAAMGHATSLRTVAPGPGPAL